MARIEKKVWPEPFAAIERGTKRFELRLQDFTVNEGDTLVLREYDPETKSYTGRTIEKRVTYILPFKIDSLPYYTEEQIQEHGLQVISIE